NNPVLPGDRLAEINAWLRKADAERVMPLGHLADFKVFLRGVNDRLGWNAANVEAGAARLASLDDDRVDAQLSGTDCADIAARAGADDQKLAGNLSHRINPRISLPGFRAAS